MECIALIRLNQQYEGILPGTILGVDEIRRKAVEGRDLYICGEYHVLDFAADEIARFSKKQIRVETELAAGWFDARAVHLDGQSGYWVHLPVTAVKAVR